MKFSYITDTSYTKKTAYIPSGSPSWTNYHVSKHLLNKNEGFYLLINLDENQIINARTSQVDTYSCTINHNPEELSCKKCNFINDCSKLLKSFTEQYLSLIKSAISNDYKKPRRARYMLHDINAKTIAKLQIIVNDDGFIIIGRWKQNDYLRIRTCFRPELSDLKHINNIKINQIFLNKKFLLNKAIKRAKIILSKKNVNCVSYYKLENWYGIKK